MCVFDWLGMRLVCVCAIGMVGVCWVMVEGGDGVCAIEMGYTTHLASVKNSFGRRRQRRVVRSKVEVEASLFA